jgi:YfiH family protein
VSVESAFWFRDFVSVPGSSRVVEVGFTDRRLDVGDRAAREVREAGLANLAVSTGAEPRLMTQVHGADVARVDRAGVDGARVEPPNADALVASASGLALVTRVADCVPILLGAPDEGLIGAVHAGREGLVLGVVVRAVEQLRELGAVTIWAWIGPHVCGRCYEVPEALRDEVVRGAPAAYAHTSWGTPALDLGAGVSAQLLEAGCLVTRLNRCTREDLGLHSHRRDGASSGRQAGVIWMSS